MILLELDHPWPLWLVVCKVLDEHEERGGISVTQCTREVFKLTQDLRVPRVRINGHSRPHTVSKLLRKMRERDLANCVEVQQAAKRPAAKLHTLTPAGRALYEKGIAEVQRLLPMFNKLRAQQ